MAADTWTAPRLLARQGRRRCVVCNQARAVEYFSSPQSRKCDLCKRERAAAPRVRRCGCCELDKPVEQFVRRGRKCADCKAGDVGPPRACFTCHEVKPATAFDFGDGRGGRGCFRRRRSNCRECIAEAEAAQAARVESRRSTWRTPRGRLVRRCSGCGETKDLERDFYNTRKPKPGEPIERTRSYRCKPCTVSRVSAYIREKAADPVEGPKLREQRGKWRRAWRSSNPKAYRAAQLRYEARVRADPARHARELENARIAYRLKRERDGLQVGTGSSSATMGPDRIGRVTLPAAPLADLLERMMVATRGTERASGVGFERLCASLGIDDRQRRAWKSGEVEGVTVAVADRVLTRAGRHAWDVWPESEYPEVHELLFGP